MKPRVPVERVQVSAYVVPTDAPEGDGTLAWDQTGMTLVEVVAGGVTGTGWTYAIPAGVGVVHGKLAAVVSGWDVMNVAGAFEAMVRAVRNDGRPGLVSMAISAVDTRGLRPGPRHDFPSCRCRALPRDVAAVATAEPPHRLASPAHSPRNLQRPAPPQREAGRPVTATPELTL